MSGQASGSTSSSRRSRCWLRVKFFWPPKTSSAAPSSTTRLVFVAYSATSSNPSRPHYGYNMTKQTAEQQRLEESRDRRSHWKRWGPYVSERAWGTVREDYSADGKVWEYLTHDQARSKAYRWSEDGIAG